MIIKQLVVGQLQTNCYLIFIDNSDPAIIVDPGDDADYIIRKITDLDLKPQFIVATHGHFDHLLAVTELRLAYRIPFLMHEADLFLLKRTRKTSKYFTGILADPILPPDSFLKKNDFITIDKLKLKVIETPGHTPGGISLYAKGFLFTGDTLFAQGIGRTDFAYGSPALLQKSIEKLYKLPLETEIFPGHGPTTSLRKARLFGKIRNKGPVV